VSVPTVIVQPWASAPLKLMASTTRATAAATNDLDMLCEKLEIGGAVGIMAD